MLFGDIASWRTVRRRCSPEVLAYRIAPTWPRMSSTFERWVQCGCSARCFTQKNSADPFDETCEQPGMGLVQGVVNENQHEGNKSKIAPEKQRVQLRFSQGFSGQQLTRASCYRTRSTEPRSQVDSVTFTRTRNCTVHEEDDSRKDAEQELCTV